METEFLAKVWKTVCLASDFVESARISRERRQPITAIQEKTGYTFRKTSQVMSLQDATSEKSKRVESESVQTSLRR
jgi:hypothetical protein